MDTLNKIAQRAEDIYENNHKSKMEKSHFGKFIVIDVISENHYLGNTSGEALQLARNKSPNGVFHLIKVGSPGVVKTNYWGRNESNVAWSL